MKRIRGYLTRSFAQSVIARSEATKQSPQRDSEGYWVKRNTGFFGLALDLSGRERIPFDGLRSSPTEELDLF